MSINSNIKWLANKVSHDGSITKKKHKRYPIIQIRVQKRELLRAIRILTTGCVSITVTEMLLCWKVSLDGIHAQHWKNLISPYIKTKS